MYRRAAPLIILLALTAPAFAWNAGGHNVATRAAVRLMPDDVPAFFRQSESSLASSALDPDVFRNPATPELTAAEAPEHFFDVELLQGRDVPADRYKFVALCAELKLDPAKVGLLPYAIAENAQRLTIAFAEHRRRPEDAAPRAKCLLYAGVLAHYAEDLCMPLHTSVHFDGRVGADGRSPRSGIHFRMDDLPGRLRLDVETVLAGEPSRPETLEALMPAVLAELAQSHALVDRVYQLEADLPPREREASWQPSGAARSLGLERTRAAAAFTASLFLTAWRNSERVQLPEWLEHTR
jgi:hypothetical protein